MDFVKVIISKQYEVYFLIFTDMNVKHVGAYFMELDPIYMQMKEVHQKMKMSKTLTNHNRKLSVHMCRTDTSYLRVKAIFPWQRAPL